jgi:hypothetical protein
MLTIHYVLGPRVGIEEKKNKYNLCDCSQWNLKGLLQLITICLECCFLRYSCGSLHPPLLLAFCSYVIISESSSLFNLTKVASPPLFPIHSTYIVYICAIYIYNTVYCYLSFTSLKIKVYGPMPEAHTFNPSYLGG